MPTISSTQTTSGPFNVRNYGAVGDGVADDSTAINAALTAAATFASGNGGAVVVIPPGKYKINSTLTLKDNCTLQAYGAYIFNGNNIFMLNGYTSVTDGSTYTEGHSNLTILGGTWDAKGQSAATDVHYNIMTFANSRNITIKDVVFRNVPGYHAVDLNSIDGAALSNCRFEGFVDNSTGGGRWFSEAVQLDQGTATNQLPCINIAVTNCYAGPAVDGSGLGGFGKLVGSHTDTTGQYYENIKIIGNTVVNPKIGIAGGPWKNSVISGNTIKNASKSGSSGGDGIRFDHNNNNAATNVVVSGNTIIDSAGAGIRFFGAASQTFDNFTVANNTIVSSSHSVDVIYGDYLLNSVISNNVIRGGTAGGISLGTADDNLVVGNNIRDVDGVGIAVSGGTRNHIKSNRLFDIGLHGVQVLNASTNTTIDSNAIRGASRTTTGTYSGIKVQSVSTSGVTISNNTIRKYGDAGNEVLYGIEITSNVTGACVRDNDISDTKISNAGTSPATGFSTPYSASVATAETLAQASGYFDLATTGPAVTCETGSTALVILGANFDHNTAGSWAFMSVAVSGATTIAAADARGCGKILTTTSEISQMSHSVVITGLTPGSNTFTAKYTNFNTTGTATFTSRHITVIPLGI